MSKRKKKMPYTMSGPIWPGLGKLVEEMGELQVNLGKLIVNQGRVDYWDDINLLPEIQDELADVLASLSYFVQMNKLDKTYIDDRAKTKMRRYFTWLENNE